MIFRVFRDRNQFSPTENEVAPAPVTVEARPQVQMLLGILAVMAEAATTMPLLTRQENFSFAA
jgi:hypothetical protein